jgi:PAS domain S-box-containing protein
MVYNTKDIEAIKLDLETFRLLSQNSFDIISILNIDGTIIFESDAVYKLLGHNPKDRQGKSIFQFLHPDDKEHIIKAFSSLNDGIQRKTYRIKHKNGNWLWFESIGKRFESAKIKEGVIINTRDITEQIRAEKELQKKEKQYRAFIEHSPDIIYKFSNKRGVLFYSDSIKKILGYEPQEILDNPFIWSQSIHPDDKEIVGKAIEDHNKGASYNIDYRIKTKSGEWIWLNDYFMYKYEDGDEIIIEGHASNITKRKELEEKLRKEEDRLSKVMLASNDGMWDWNLVTNEVYFDPQYYKMVGYHIDEFPHQLNEFQKRIHPDEVNHVMNEAQKHLEGATDRFKVEFRFKTKSGNWHWIMGRGIIVEKDENDKPIRFIGTHTDIHKRKNAELALLKSEQKFKALVNNTADGLLILHPKNGVEYVSPSYLKILGYKKETELGRSIENIAELIHPDEREIVFQNIFSAIENKEDNLSYVFRVKHKNGHYIWRRDKATFEYDENGDYQRAYVVCSDITKEVKQKQLLDQRKNYLVALNQGSNIFQEGEFMEQIKKFVELIGKASNASRTCVFKNHKDKNGLLLMSQVAEYVAPGISPKNMEPEFKNIPYAEVFPRWEKQLGKNKMISGRVADLPESEQKIITEQDILAILIIPIIIENEFWGFIGFDNCVNDREWQFAEIEYLKASAEKISNRIKKDREKEILKNKNKELEQANATKDRFISILSHDLRGPFNSILGLAELLVENIDEYSKDKIKEFVDAIYETSNETFILLSNLLEWSRIQRDKATFNPTNLALQNLAKKSINPLKQSATDKKITIEIKISENLIIQADELMLNAIIRNLVSNAIKFTPENGLVIISAEKQSNILNLHITDTGVGMQEETVKSLFKLDKTNTTRGTKGEKGTGFGLLLCKELVDKHGGSIHVTSQVGKGSNFCIQLPKEQKIKTSIQ